MKSNRAFLFVVILLALGTLACSAVSSFIATPTPVPTSTPLPTPTPLPSPTPVPSAALFEETEFDRASCFPTNSSDDVERYSENGEFHMVVKTPNIIAWSVCEGNPFDDFIFEADATTLEGPEDNAFGVVFRYNDSTDEFYNFSISADGYYVLTLDGYNYEQPQFLVDWNTSSAINTGNETNHIKVVVVGDKIEYYVNDQLLGEVTDPNLDTGNVGFFASSFDAGGVHIKFDNLTISKP